MIGTVWAILPALIAIVLALITKQVYISLFLGLFIGAMCVAGGNLLVGFEKLVECVSSNIYGGGEHAYIIMFSLCLGILVVLITISGGSFAYGEWSTKRIKTKRGALLSTFGLGLIIFIDDYFNCLTVGNVMRPVTDKNKVSREKLSYIIDSTAAPVCIIAPISSWAAAVGSTLGINNGFEVFLKSIPFNLYALLTVGMVLIVSTKNFNFGPMKRAEEQCKNSSNLEMDTDDKIGGVTPNPKGKVIDLLLPIIFLIITSIFFMLYTGGIFSGSNIVEAFSSCEASKSLSISSLLTLIVFYVYYIARGLITFEQVGDSIIGGFRTMVPTILILILAWSLGSMCSSTDYLSLSTCETFHALENIGFLFPAITFVSSALIAFSTGTSWGTFAILLPLVPEIISIEDPLFFVAVASVLGGAVCGDHMSPISDTTILSATGARCNHMNHVKSQMPYSLLVASCVFITYLVLGILSIALKNVSYGVYTFVSLILGFALLFLTVFIISKISKSEINENDNNDNNTNNDIALKENISQETN